MIVRLFSIVLLLISLSPAGKADIKEWNGVAENLPLSITCNEDALQTSMPVAVYLTNLDIPRIGTESDESIKEALRHQGLLLIDLDCRTLAVSLSEKEEFLKKFHEQLPGNIKKIMGAKLAPNFNEVYYLPPGYRVARKLPFWSLEKHGKRGTLERIMQTYNGHVVEKFHVSPIHSTDELRGPGGKPLDYNLYCDIIYPSQPARESVPLIVNFATRSERMSSFHSAQRMIYPMGFTVGGYAWAIVDHCFNPLAREDSYGFWPNQYTLEDWNGLAAATASIRFFRAHAKEYGLNGKIGVMGHSKASYSVVRLTDPANASGREFYTFKDFPNEAPEPQPWPGFPSTVDVGYASMGNGLRRPQYIVTNATPLAVGVGRFDKFGHWNIFPSFVAACEKQGINYIALWMEDLGHDYPFGVDYATGEKRYSLLRRFFDQNLHPRSNNDLEVLYVIPRNNANGVDLTGSSRVLTEDQNLPTNMKGISPFSPITVRFARPMLPESVQNAIAVKETKSGKVIRGNWTASLHNTRYEFAPSPELEADMEYRVTVSTDAKDTEGNALKTGFESQFTTRLSK